MTRLVAWVRRVLLSRRRAVVIGGGAILVAIGLWRGAPVDSSLAWVVQTGTLTAQLTATGTLRPTQSVTYRSPLAGREAEITHLVPEGTRVRAGDLLVQLETADLTTEAAQTRREVRQTQTDLQIAEVEYLDAQAAVKTATEGEGALAVAEAKGRLQLAQRRVERLRDDLAQLKPLLNRGFITRNELGRVSDELERAEEEFAIAAKRRDVAVEITYPREAQRSTVLLAQRAAQVESVRARLQESQARLEVLLRQIAECRIVARRPGLVVYEEMASASPRRKIRTGDRVNSSQGLVTIPDVNQMLLESSVSEADVHRVKPGQPASIRLEAFPSLRLTGRVMRVGTLATASADRPGDEKRFDLVIGLDPFSADLRPEMTALAEVLVTVREGVLLVPVNAVFEDRGGFIVRVASGTRIAVRTVTLGESNDRFAEVLSGVSAGERVLLVPSSRVQAASGPGAQVSGERSDGLQPR
jgi:HlyD family secretion protein